MPRDFGRPLGYDPRAMRTAFFGTPAIAVPAFHAVRETTDLRAVVCQPDRPAGRGLKLTPPAVKQAAIEAGLGDLVHQPVKVKTGNLDEWLREREIDVAIVLAYGRILPAAVLSAPRLGCLNLHASLLPKYRGAAPINWAIVHGETETGVALMQMDEGLDTGPVFVERRIPIGPEETAGELAERIAELAAVVVREDLPRVLAGEIESKAQDAALATHAPLIEKEHCRVQWNQPVANIVDLVRGMSPRPGAFTELNGQRLKLARVRPAKGVIGTEPPGTVSLGAVNEVRVRAADGFVELVRAQLEGRRELDGRDLVNGRALAVGDVLG
jgi:methionyl-tRNA formyltransferase